MRKICNLGIKAVKSRETRAVIYACRYFSGHFNPYNSVNAIQWTELRIKLSSRISACVDNCPCTMAHIIPLPSFAVG